MKKLTLILIALVLSMALAVSVYAQQTVVKLEGTTSQPGHTLFLKVMVTESLAGDTMGITYSFDENLLEAVPESCSWEKAGVLQDFSLSDEAGVWTANQETDLYGTVCILAFRVREDAKPVETTVKCTLIVKRGAENVGSFTAEATVKIVCGHTYGRWESNGEMFHKRVCSLCADVQNQAHTWDEGTVSQSDKENTDIKTYRCTVCGATKQEEIPGTETEEEATQPSSRPTGNSNPNSTLPTVTRPTEPAESSNPTQPGNQQPTQSSNPTQPGNQQPTQSSNPTQSGSQRPTQNGNSSQTGGDQKPSTAPGTQGQNGNNGVPQASEKDPSAVTTPHSDETADQTENTATHDHENATPAQTQYPTQDPHAGHDHSSADTAPSANAEQRLIAAIGIFLVLGLFLAVSAWVVKRKH